VTHWFNDTVSISEYMTSNHTKKNTLQMTYKKRDCRLIWVLITRAWRHSEKLRKPSAGTVGVPAEIRTRVRKVVPSSNLLGLLNLRFCEVKHWSQTCSCSFVLKSTRPRWIA